MTTPALRPDFAQALVPFDLQDEARRRGTQILRNFFAYLSNVHTRKAYAEDLRVFTQFMRGIYHERLSPAQVVDLFLFGGQHHGGRSNHAHANAVAECFRAWQLKLDRSTGTINRRLTVLRGLTAAARRLGLLAWPLEVRSLRHELRSDTRGPATADVIRLIDHLAAIRSPLAVRDTAIIRLMHDLGLRRGEVASLDVSSITVGDETLRVVGKGQREAVSLSVPTPTLEAVTAWLDVRGTEPGPLFLLAIPGTGQAVRFYREKRMTGFAIYKQIRGYGRALNLKLRPHGFRHTAITTAMISAGESGIPFEEVMQFSRHRQIVTLMRYRDFLENRQPALAQAVAARVTPSSKRARGGQPRATPPSSDRLDVTAALDQITDEPSPGQLQALARLCARAHLDLDTALAALAAHLTRHVRHLTASGRRRILEQLRATWEAVGSQSTPQG